jgi:GT2 family glycosyltransferase
MYDMKASFVVVNYNRKDEILLTIAKTKALQEFNPDFYEIIVVDNASNDGSIPALRELGKAIILIENQVNSGASAWNLGFEKATGKYFVILDDDSHIDSGLTDALRYLDTNREVGVLALNITGGAFQTSHWKHLAEYAGFIGCGAIIRKSLYDQIGGYASWIFLYTNEYEYGIRCMDAGYKIRYFAKCMVTHRTSNINRSSERLIIYSVRNEMAIVYKYFNQKHRTLFLVRVYLNNLRCAFQHGIISIPWYVRGLLEFQRVKKSLGHTPVSQEVENFYSKDFWSTRKFLGIF